MEVKVTTELPESQNLAEIYQSMTCKQALLHKKEDKHFERITAYVLCRDFLVDSYTYAKAKKDFGIYGFHFKGSKESPDYSGAHILMHFPNKTAKKCFDENLEILHGIEENNDFKKTIIHENSDKEMEYVVVGDKKWLTNCLMFSLYSLLLRAFCYNISEKKEWYISFGKKDSSDSKYVKSVDESIWKKLTKDISFLMDAPGFCGFSPSDVSVGTIHHNSGFISVFGNHSELNTETVKTNKHWKHFKELGLKLKTV